MRITQLIFILGFLILFSGCSIAHPINSQIDDKDKMCTETFPQNALLYDEIPELPGYILLDDTVRIEGVHLKANYLLGERVLFDPQNLIDVLFRTSDYEVRSGNSIGYIGKPVGDMMDKLIVGDRKIHILLPQNADNTGWFLYKCLRRLIPVEEPYCWDTTLRVIDWYVPRPYGYGAQATQMPYETQSPGLAPYLSAFVRGDFSFRTFSDVQAQVEQVLATLDLKEMEIRWGCAIDVETMNKILDRHNNPIPEDRDVYYFRLTQKYDGIPILDSVWLAKETEETKKILEETKPSPFSSTQYDPCLHDGTYGEVYINQYGLVQMSVNGVHRFRKDGEAQDLISCAKALEIVLSFYAQDPPREAARISSAQLVYVTTDVAVKNSVYHYIPAWVFDVWEYDEREINNEERQHATLNRFVIDAVTGERLSDNG